MNGFLKLLKNSLILIFGIIITVVIFYSCSSKINHTKNGYNASNQCIFKTSDTLILEFRVYHHSSVYPLKGTIRVYELFRLLYVDSLTGSMVGLLRRGYIQNGNTVKYILDSNHMNLLKNKNINLEVKLGNNTNLTQRMFYPTEPYVIDNVINKLGKPIVLNYFLKEDCCLTENGTLKPVWGPYLHDDNIPNEDECPCR